VYWTAHFELFSRISPTVTKKVVIGVFVDFSCALQRDCIIKNVSLNSK
jgi:hypothetical protein